MILEVTEIFGLKKLSKEYDLEVTEIFGFKKWSKEYDLEVTEIFEKIKIEHIKKNLGYSILNLNVFLYGSNLWVSDIC